jgi:MarR family transcriptional regulator, 2-MHQ and catechol-resistance regulon repressor
MDKICSNQPYLLLMQTTKAIQECIKANVAKHELSVTEFSVLEVLFHKGTQTIHEVGSSILVASGSMTYVVDKLVQKGFLERNNCPGDRRAIHISLSGQGRLLMDSLIPEHQVLIDSMFASFNHHEVNSLIDVLRKTKKKVQELSNE